MTGAAGIQFGLGLFLAILGAVCFYAFFFWESAKKVLAPEAQEAIGRFAQSRITWFGMLFLVLQTLIFSRFIEQHRWPFSYPADPSVYAALNRANGDAANLSKALQTSEIEAKKWRFSSSLRNGAFRANGERIACPFILILGPGGGNAWNIWGALQPMLDLARWENVPFQYRMETASQLPSGISVLSGSENTDSFMRNSAFKRARGRFSIDPPLIANKPNIARIDSL